MNQGFSCWVQWWTIQSVTKDLVVGCDVGQLVRKQLNKINGFLVVAVGGGGGGGGGGDRFYIALFSALVQSHCALATRDSK